MKAVEKMIKEFKINKYAIRDNYLKDKYKSAKKMLTLLAIIFPAIVTLLIGVGIALSLFADESSDFLFEQYGNNIMIYMALYLVTVFFRALFFGFVIKFISQFVYKKNLAKRDRENFRYFNCDVGRRENIKTFLTDTSIIYNYDKYNNNNGGNNTYLINSIELEIKYTDVERIVRTTIDDVLHIYCNYKEETDKNIIERKGWYHFPLIFCENNSFVNTLVEKTGKSCEIIEHERYSLN